MLVKPSIIKMPNSAFPINPISSIGCTSGTYYAPGNGEKCINGFSCKPYSMNNNDCVDASYCGVSLGATVGLGVVGVGATIISIT